jgi:hypothetical protein
MMRGETLTQANRVLKRIETDEYGEYDFTLRALDQVIRPYAEALVREATLADARLDLLREHYGYDRDGIPRGKIDPCLDPQRFGVDCGKCIRCRSIYTEGALVKP